jgi:hypothetical protein
VTLGRAAIVESVGWVATAAFVGSYFCTRGETLLRAQIAGALAWVAYGALARAPPVIVANLLVVAAAVWKAARAKVPPSRQAPTSTLSGSSPRATEVPARPA